MQHFGTPRATRAAFGAYHHHHRELRCTMADATEATLWFTREKRKIQMRSGMGSDEVYEPRWVHYNSLKFLTTGNPTQQSLSNMHTEHEVEVGCVPAYKRLNISDTYWQKGLCCDFSTLYQKCQNSL